MKLIFFKNKNFYLVVLFILLVVLYMHSSMYEGFYNNTDTERMMLIAQNEQAKLADDKVNNRWKNSKF